MSYVEVEVETGEYIKRWAFWNPATWSIPKLYWDAWSVEQRTHAICRQLEKVIKYADYLGVNTDDIAARLKAIEEGQLDEVITAAVEEWFIENEPTFAAELHAMMEALPIGEFDAENTVKSNIDALNANMQTVNTTTDELVERVNTRQGQYLISPLLLGTMVFSYQNGMYDHPGCICSYNNVQYVYSQPESPANNTAHSRIISIQNNQDDPDTMKTVALGHCNSAAFDTNNNRIYIAPVFDYSGGTAQPADYIDQIIPNDTFVTQYPTPEWIMSVSFDSVTEKLYALSFSGMIYEIDEATHTFTEVKQTVKRSHDAYNQDFAIHDSKYVISSPAGYLIIGTLEGNDESIACLDHIDSAYLFEWGELDGMEFDENGHLLAIAHTNQLDDRPAFVYEIPVFDDVYPLYDYMFTPPSGIGTSYTLYVAQNVTLLRCDGFTSAKALKSINFLNVLADDTQRSIVLASDYTCRDFRIGNNTYNWISFSGHTLEVTNQMTVQTPIIFNGSGTLHLANPINVQYGIIQIGFYSLNITVDTDSNLLASNPAGALIFFGPIGTLSPSPMKVNSARTANIAASQVYYLGTLTQ